MIGLRPATLAVGRALAATMFDPGTGTPVPEERLAWLSRELDDYALRAGPRTANGLSLIFLALQLLPLFVIGKLSRFTRLALADRTRYLERIERSRLLSPLIATTKIVLALLYFEHPDALKEAGVNVGCMHPPKDTVALRPAGGAP